MVPQNYINFLMKQKSELMSTARLFLGISLCLFLAETSSCSNCQVTQQL